MFMHVYIYINMSRALKGGVIYENIYKYMYMHVYIYVYIYICIHIHMHVYVYA
jgi:hypothetical protein